MLPALFVMFLKLYRLQKYNLSGRSGAQSLLQHKALGTLGSVGYKQPTRSCIFSFVYVMASESNKYNGIQMLKVQYGGIH